MENEIIILDWIFRGIEHKVTRSGKLLWQSDPLRSPKWEECKFFTIEVSKRETMTGIFRDIVIRDWSNSVVLQETQIVQ